MSLIEAWGSVGYKQTYSGLKYESVNSHHVITPNGGVYNFGLNSFSIACYFKVNQLPAAGKKGGIYAKRGGANFGYILEVNSSGSLITWTYNGSGEDIIRAFATISTGILYYCIIRFVYTNPGWSVEAWLDNVQYGATTHVNNNAFDSADNLYTGLNSQNLGNNFFLDGETHDLQFYSKSLSTTEMTTLYDSKGETIPGTALANLVSQHKYDDGEGFTATEEVAANNGTLQNYTAPEVTKGSNNKWVDIDGNPIKQ